MSNIFTLDKTIVSNKAFVYKNTTPIANDQLTQILYHFDGDGTTFIDSSSKNLSSASVIAYGSATQSNAQSKFGGKSLSLPSGSSYLRLPYNSNFNLSGSGDFTIDTWFYLTSLSGLTAVCSKDTYGTNLDWSIEIRNATTFRAVSNGGGSYFDGIYSTGLQLNQWYHLALVKYNGTSKFYINGKALTGTGNFGYSNNSTIYWTIGCASYNNPQSFLRGYIDEFRISKTARWTTDFTPQTVDYDSAITEGVTGLTPTEITTLVVPGGSLTAAPTITEIGKGWYSASINSSDHVASLWDFGATATPRYHLFDFPSNSNINPVFFIKDRNGVPLSGMTPSFDIIFDQATGTPIAAPTITDIGHGIYSVDTVVNQSMPAVGGTLTLGLTPTPTLLAYEEVQGGGLVGGFEINTIASSHRKLNLTAPFNLKSLVDRNDWYITKTGSEVAAVSVLEVTINGDTITIDTTEQTNGGAYILHLPNRYILSEDGKQQCTTETLNFTGIGQSPLVFRIDIDPNRNFIDVIFNEDMYEPDALDSSKYVLDNGATISSVVKINAATYRLFTTPLTSGVTYNLTTSARDIYFNA